MPSRNAIKSLQSNKKLEPADRQRSTKGQRTERAILDAALKIIDKSGFAAASQEAIAKTAGISQSTLRHYFPTVDELHNAIFATQYLSYREEMERILLQPMTEPKEMILTMVQAHLDHIGNASDSLAFETHAYLSRNAMPRLERNKWFEWLAEHYAAAISRIRPGLAKSEYEARAFEILTITLGSWMTVARSRPNLTDKSTDQLKSRLAGLVEMIIERK